VRIRLRWERFTPTLAWKQATTERTLTHAFASDALNRNVRYAKLADGALVDVLRPPDLSLACRSPKNEAKKRSTDAQFWRGGRDSNPQLPT
jgi:hypothetical protein